MFEGCYTVVLSSQGRRRLREGQEPPPLCKLFESKKCPLFFSYTLRDNLLISKRWQRAIRFREQRRQKSFLEKDLMGEAGTWLREGVSWEGEGQM